MTHSGGLVVRTYAIWLLFLLASCLYVCFCHYQIKAKWPKKKNLEREKHSTHEAYQKLDRRTLFMFILDLFNYFLSCLRFTLSIQIVLLWDNHLTMMMRLLWKLKKLFLSLLLSDVISLSDPPTAGTIPPPLHLHLPVSSSVPVSHIHHIKQIPVFSSVDLWLHTVP